MTIQEKKIKDEWDEYWTVQGHATNRAYNFFADFYRNRIIKPYLNHFLKKHFAKGQSVLHAGCGSGKVDTDIVYYLAVTALDISPQALSIYRSVNQAKAQTIEGSIFSLPIGPEIFDGVYNLGVMEHFTEPEMGDILREFKRVLKPGGKIILFIPPVFGLTVQILDLAHFILNKVLRENVKLHPDEITRIKSRRHIQSIIEKAGFEFVEYYFGWRDLFTQIVVVGKSD